MLRKHNDRSTNWCVQP